MTGTRETAAQLDSAIDAVLRGPAGPVVLDEGQLTATARLLRDALPRLHPRFGFEEHLAARLAAARRAADAVVSLPQPIPIRPEVVAAESARERAVEHVGAEHRRLGLVAGGAIASGVSLAGAAIVVWRRSRSGGIF